MLLKLIHKVTTIALNNRLSTSYFSPICFYQLFFTNFVSSWWQFAFDHQEARVNPDWSMLPKMWLPSWTCLQGWTKTNWTQVPIKWNVITCITWWSNFSFFAAFYFARLELLPCLQARASTGGNRGSKVYTNTFQFIYYKTISKVYSWE